jgi:hypothetical protein
MAASGHPQHGLVHAAWAARKSWKSSLAVFDGGAACSARCGWMKFGVP